MREFASGVGFVDVGISFGSPLHLIELKILKGKLTGASQLATYMTRERRKTGWLILVDVRASTRRTAVPSRIATQAGTIRTLSIDVNPTPPHLN